MGLEPCEIGMIRYCNQELVSSSRGAFMPRSLMSFTGQTVFRIAVIVIAVAALRAIRADEGFPTREAMTSAVAKSLPLLEKGAKGSLEQRKQCFNWCKCIKKQHYRL